MEKLGFKGTNCVPYTMVFGAVATGSIKPSDAASVAGIISNKGDKPVLC